MAIRNFNIPSPQDPVSKQITQVPLPVAPTPEKALNIIVTQNFNDKKSDIISTFATAHTSDNFIRKSKLGNPVYSEVVIKKSQDIVVDSDSFSSEKGYIRFDTCIVTVNQQRNIIKTPIQGRNGTVKEYISDGDYSINIKGSILGDGADKLPEKIIKDAHTLFIEPNELWLECEFLRYFGIQYCVIESYNIDQV